MFERTDALDELTQRYGPWLDLASIARTDTIDGVTLVLDEVADATGDDGDALTDQVWRLFNRYLALDYICGRLGALFDVSRDNKSYALSKAYAQASAERDKMRARLDALAPGLIAYGVITTAANEIVTITAPYLNDPWATASGEWSGH